MAKHIIKITGPSTSASIPNPGEISLQPTPTEYSIDMGGGDVKFEVGDTIELVNDFDISTLKDNKGDDLDLTLVFSGHSIWAKTISDGKMFIAHFDTGAQNDAMFKNWFLNKGSTLYTTVEKQTWDTDTLNQYTCTSFTEPKPELIINGKSVKNIYIPNDFVPDHSYSIDVVENSDFSNPPIADTRGDWNIIGDGVQLAISTKLSLLPKVGETFLVSYNEFEITADVSKLLRTDLSSSFNGGPSNPAWFPNFTNKNSMQVLITEQVKKTGKVQIELAFKVTKIDGIMTTCVIDNYHSTVNGIRVGDDSTTGKRSIETITINGRVYSLTSNVNVTEDELLKLINLNILWSQTEASIPGALQIKGLDVVLSKTSGIKDGEEITVTVKYDSNVSDTLNGVASDTVLTNFPIIHKDKFVTDQEIEDYVNSNIAWAGGSGNVDVSGWPALHPFTKLHVDNVHVTAGDAINFTVIADQGFLINGAANYKHMVAIKEALPPHDYLLTPSDWANSVVDGGEGTTYLNFELHGYTGKPMTSSSQKNIHQLIITFDKDMPNIKNRYINILNRDKSNIGVGFDYGRDNLFNLNFNSGETWYFDKTNVPVKLS